MMRTRALSLALITIFVVTATHDVLAQTMDTSASTGMVFRTGATSPTTERMRITTAGNVGIGTTNPSTKIEVIGSVSGTAIYSNGELLTMPIGIIIPWHKSMTGVPGTLPVGWLECNGQTVSDASSPLNGQALPDLNSQLWGGGRGHYLRGGTTSGDFNTSTYYTGNNADYSFGQSSGTYYGIGYGRSQSNETGAFQATYNASSNGLGNARIMVAAMTVVFIMKVK